MTPNPPGPSATSVGEPTAEVAFVLFMDVVSFSRLFMDQQLEVKRKLDALVAGLPEFQKALVAGNLVPLPTGDGMALAFFKSWMAPVQCARRIAMALKQDPFCALRMGVHAGPVYPEGDINANLNVTGGGINSAQRVMDVGDAGHILVSKVVADMLTQFSVWRASLGDLGEAVVKHGERIHIYNLFTEDYGNPARPAKMGSATGSEKVPVPHDMVGKFEDAELARLETRLAASVGPIAKALVAKSAARQSTMTGLCRDLAEQIPVEADRLKFLREVGAVSGTHVAPPAPANRPAFDEHTLEAACKALASYLGPMTSLVVSRVARSVHTKEELKSALAAEIPDERARRVFLASF